MTDDTFLTLREPSSGLYKEKGSKFLSFAHPADSEEQIRGILGTYRKQYFDATHHCYAWRLGFDKKKFRANDDGEPSGTAGLPILGQIQSKNLTDLLILVIRYFGGTKLGTSGLIHAYRVAAQECLASDNILEKTINQNFEISCPYESVDEVMRLIKEFKPKVLNQEFLLACTFRLEIRQSYFGPFCQKLKLVQGLQFQSNQ